MLSPFRYTASNSDTIPIHCKQSSISADPDPDADVGVDAKLQIFAPGHRRPQKLRWSSTSSSRPPEWEPSRPRRWLEAGGGNYFDGYWG